MSLSPEIFGAQMKKWVAMQKQFLESLNKAEKDLKDADRLELVLASRVAFQHVITTAQAFDKWLQDPFIVGHMPKHMLEEVREKIWKILKELVELDIAHTSEFAEHIEKLARENKLNPLLYKSSKKESEGPRLSI